jgi:regulator of replication initiation timing
VPTGHKPRISKKRKADDDDLREENKRLRFENQELRRKIEAGYLQQGAMMEQIDMLEKTQATIRHESAGLMVENATLAHENAVLANKNKILESQMKT